MPQTHIEIESEGAAIADLWAALVDAAAAGDTESRQFLRMFEPFVLRARGAESRH